MFISSPRYLSNIHRQIQIVHTSATCVSTHARLCTIIRGIIHKINILLCSILLQEVFIKKLHRQIQIVHTSAICVSTRICLCTIIRGLFNRVNILLCLFLLQEVFIKPPQTNTDCTHIGYMCKHTYPSLHAYNRNYLIT